MTRSTRFAVALLEAIDYVISSERWSTKAVLTLLAIVGTAFATHDIYQIATGTVNVNRHCPVIMPVVFAGFAALVRTIDRVGKRSASERAE